MVSDYSFVVLIVGNYIDNPFIMIRNLVENPVDIKLNGFYIPGVPEKGSNVFVFDFFLKLLT